MPTTLAPDSWYQSAADLGRRRLFPRGIVALFAFVMILVGWLALPSKHLHERLANAHETDLLTIAYLHAWLNADPGDLRIKLTLARHEALIGRNQQALASIAQLINSRDKAQIRSARRLRLNVLERMLHELNPSDPRREALLVRIRSAIEIVAADATDPIEIEAMMHRAQAVDHPVLAASLLSRLITLDLARDGEGSGLTMPSGRQRSVADLARQAIGLGDFRLAAALYWRAFDEANSHERRLELLIQVAHAEQAGNRLPQFFIALESRLEGLYLDTARCRILTRLALAANRLDLAEKFARRMLQFSGWWQGWGVSETGKLIKVGLRWLLSAASTLSPISTAHAQELEPAHESSDRLVFRDSSRVSLVEPVTGAQLSRSIKSQFKLKDQMGLDELITRIVTSSELSAVLLDQRSVEQISTKLIQRTKEQHTVQGGLGDWAFDGGGIIEVPVVDEITVSDQATANPIPSDPGFPDRRLPDPLNSAPKTELIARDKRKSFVADTLSDRTALDPPRSRDRSTTSDYPERNEPFAVRDDLNGPLSGTDPFSALERLIGRSIARHSIKGTSIDEQQRATSRFKSTRRNDNGDQLSDRRSAENGFVHPHLSIPKSVMANEWPSLTPAQENEAMDASGKHNAELARELAVADDQQLAALDHQTETIRSAASASGQTVKYRSTSMRANREPVERPQLAFDQESYLLAYQVFLARGSLENAYAVAFSAVDQQPELAQWRIRLAETAQWTQRPVRALAQWRYLANRFDKREYWEKVSSLAIGVRDVGSQLEYLYRKLSRNPNDSDAIVEVARTYEQMGTPERSIRWLQGRIEQVSSDRGERLYDELADVAERTGNPSLLIQVLTTQLELYGPNIQNAMRLSSEHYLRGNGEAAFRALHSTVQLANDSVWDSVESERSLRFWTDYTELARLLQRYDDAVYGYQKMLRLENFNSNNLRAMSMVLEERSLSAAAHIMSLAYFRYMKLSFADRAISLWLRDGRLDLAESFLDELPDDVRLSIIGGSSFLKHRAAYYLAIGETRKSIADRLAIFRLAPQNMENRAAILWSLLADRDNRRLHSLLGQWGALADKTPVLWGPFGAALLALGEPQKALKYFVWQARGRDDYLWWLAYADALQATGRQDAAWSLRRRTWTELRKDGQHGLSESPEKRERIVALAMRFAPADEARALLSSLVSERQKLLRHTQAGGNRSPADGLSHELRITADIAASANAGSVLAKILYDKTEAAVVGSAAASVIDTPGVAQRLAMRSATSELAVSYLLSRQNVDGARAWLLSRYAKDLVQPAWARLSIALVNRDNNELDHLLDTMPDWLPRLERIEALKRVGRTAEAQTESFESLTAQPDNDLAHQQMVDLHVAEDQPSMGLAILSAQQGVLDYSRNRADAAMRLDQHGKIYFYGETGRTDSVDASVLRNAKGSTRQVGVGLNWTRSNGSWSAELAQRDGLESNATVRARWQRSLGPMIDFSISGGINQATSELPALIVGGQKDLLEAQTILKLTGRDYISGLATIGRLETQLGTQVGRLNRFSFEYGHHWRLDYPDVTLRAQFSASNYSQNNVSDPLMTRLAPLGALNPIDSFVPASSRQLDVYLNIGESVRNRYTRALRFFGEAGLSYNSVSGNGFSLRGGIGTSVFGTDQLTIFGGLTSKSPGNTRGSQEFGLTYRMRY